MSPDLIEGEWEETTGGVRARRVFQVTELSGDPARRLPDAARASGIPVVGQAHPRDGLARVTRRRARATADPSVALVEVEYESASTAAAAAAGGWQIEVTATLIDEVTVHDAFGRVMGTSYTKSLFLAPGQYGSVTTTRTHRVEVQRPTIAIEYTREQATSAYAVGRLFSGSVNGSTWNGEPPDRWLMVAESTPQTNGRHRVKYSFTLNQRGWQAELTEQENGVVPFNIRIGNGLNFAQIYPRQNFHSLGLPPA